MFPSTVFALRVEQLSAETQAYLERYKIRSATTFSALAKNPAVDMSSLAQVPEDVPKILELINTTRVEACRARQEWMSATDEDLFYSRKLANLEHPLKAEGAPVRHVKRTVNTQLAASSQPKKLRRVRIWEGHPRARAMAEEVLKKNWVSAAGDLLKIMDTDVVMRAESMRDPAAALGRMCSNLRPATLRGHVRAWRSFWNWWRASGGNGFPRNATAFTKYLEMRAAEPCSPSAIVRALTALRFFEAAAGIPLDKRIGRDPWLIAQSVRGVS